MGLRFYEFLGDPSLAIYPSSPHISQAPIRISPSLFLYFPLVSLHPSSTLNDVIRPALFSKVHSTTGQERERERESGGWVVNHGAGVLNFNAYFVRLFHTSPFPPPLSPVKIPLLPQKNPSNSRLSRISLLPIPGKSLFSPCIMEIFAGCAYLLEKRVFQSFKLVRKVPTSLSQSPSEFIEISSLYEFNEKIHP